MRFRARVRPAHALALLIVGVVTSVIAAYFYLRVVLTLYAAEDTQDAPDGVELEATRIPVGAPATVVLAACVVMTLWIGILPSVFIDFARDATLLF